ncbi:putative WD repeat-containing protein 43-like [Capsicum annuum]|nr:putative WD repeat-containing protein 43-like [Capsicum annuum]
MAHAGVASLMRTIESLLTSNSPMQSLICDHREELCALREKVSSLEVFVKNFEKNKVFGEMTDFEVEVKEVASAVEYRIQLRLTETVLGVNKRQKKKVCRKFRESLQKVAKDMDRIWNESTELQDKGKEISKESLVHEFSSSTNDILNVSNNMVGRDDQKERLLEDLTVSYSGEPKVIPIVGMGGIGKTTLAKEVYNHESILCRFDVRAWATVSQQHNRKEILLGLLRSTIKIDDTRGEAELANVLQKSLKRKSRILLTTRNDEVACYASIENLSLRMSFMDQDESWILFKTAAFSGEALPYEFETVGKQIADECHGLPLTIVVVAGLLKSKRAIEDWESVAKDVKSFLTNDLDEQCSRMIGLSYNHLTSYQKTCLLHFGIFREDSEIPAKNLMRSWIAEGFLKLENDLEGEAEKYLEELVDRCLVLVCKKSLDGTKIRSCRVHDLIYDLCVREIQRENIFIMNDIVLDQSVSEWGPLSMQKMQPFKRVNGDKIDYCPNGLYRALLTPVHRQLRDDNNNDLLKRTSSIFSFRLKNSYFPLKSNLIHFKLLKVLELRNIEIDNFPVQILSLIWLRYLSLLCPVDFDIPPEIYCPSGSADKWSHMGFSNIQTISYLSPRCCTKERLETLSFHHLPASAKAFPATLKKLKLRLTALSWSYLDIIAELPNLEVLKLMPYACLGNEWYPNVKGFTRLKLLLMKDNYLKYWKATNDNFPVLERLVLKECHNLKEIPIEFAEIHTLQLIEFTSCLPELGDSAARIQQEQEDLGNNPVDVRISNPIKQCVASKEM